MNMSDWVKCKNKLPPSGTCVLAIIKSEPNTMYNMAAHGWFRDTIYSCRIDENKFIIQSHGPFLPATHWMPLPEEPIDD